MTDTRPRAEQKAREKHTGSARQQAKEALREEISTFNGAGVKKIASAAESRAGDDNRRLRVVAYCRVSTDDLDQTISIELQKDEYKRKIKANPQWIYGGTYADDGFSGTNTEHRPAFRLMMEDALAGRFDMIITKSVSRFARNLVDCIQWVRKLQNLNPPIKVFFEQENIDTLQSTSNIILFVLAMVAEEESHMKPWQTPMNTPTGWATSTALSACFMRSPAGWSTARSARRSCGRRGTPWRRCSGTWR